MTRHDLDFRKALHDPRGVFGTPERVLADPRLDREGKRAILNSWEQDARELAVAEEEGMAGGESNMLERVLRALDVVSDGRPEEGGTITKHGGRAQRTQTLSGGTRTGLLVKDAMCALSEVVHIDQDLREASLRMRDHQSRFLPVVDGDEVVGILTARDAHGEPPAGEAGPSAAKVQDRLSTEIAFCFEDDDLQTAAAVIDRSGHRRLLVTDSDLQVVGLTTLEMINSALRQHDRRGSSGPGTDVAERVSKRPARAKGDRPGHPGMYAIKPKIKT